ncbi:hypothetical protein OHA37_26820 [Streptomyces sp. NBC_00335]|uniref:hypothetical protein n=1 Tax=unclassified Streptomyces TaxID=2593676 RepID=UPI002251E787|nr:MULTISPECIES: hypothetical protein [unclassified Streptomyces]MCX5407463.1 hypothetical protein [Streptomyces sp. NBC_00086]
MPRQLTLAERLATAEKDIQLATIRQQSSWDAFIVQQAVLHFGEIATTFSCNDIRHLLPEMGRGFVGAAINGLSHGGIIEKTGDRVPSDLPSTKAHEIRVWRLTGRGHEIAAKRRDRRREAA